MDTEIRYEKYTLFQGYLSFEFSNVNQSIHKNSFGQSVM